MRVVNCTKNSPTFLRTTCIFQHILHSIERTYSARHDISNLPSPCRCCIRTNLLRIVVVVVVVKLCVGVNTSRAHLPPLHYPFQPTFSCSKNKILISYSVHFSVFMCMYCFLYLIAYIKRRERNIL